MSRKEELPTEFALRWHRLWDRIEELRQAGAVIERCCLVATAELCTGQKIDSEFYVGYSTTGVGQWNGDIVRGPLVKAMVEPLGYRSHLGYGLRRETGDIRDDESYRKLFNTYAEDVLGARAIGIVGVEDNHVGGVFGYNGVVWMVDANRGYSRLGENVEKVRQLLFEAWNGTSLEMWYKFGND